MASNQKSRIPVEVDGIQVNFCKNPRCANFGKPASQENQKRGRPKNESGGDSYIVVGKTKKGRSIPVLHCKVCGETFAMKSNLAISEELTRLSSRLQKPHLQLFCPDSTCPNHGRSVMVSPRSYIPFKKTTAGNPRFRCGKCGKSFTVRYHRNPIARQREHSHLNRDIFLEMVNKMPFRGISSKHNISMQTIYDKIDFYYRQCVAFAANRERKFPEMNFRTRYISVDRQHYRLNWTNKSDRRNVILYGIGSTDRWSGYLFGQHINFDSSLAPSEIEEDAEAIGDYDLKDPFRKYARLWLRKDRPLPLIDKPEKFEVDPSIITNVKRTYAESVVRADVEVEENLPSKKQLNLGMLVHSEYTMYAHFRYLKNLLSGANKLVFYLDQESGIRAACLSAFWEEVLEKRVEAFYVKLDKELTNDEKLHLVASGAREAEEHAMENLGYDEASLYSLRQLAIEKLLTSRVKVGPWDDEWLPYPFPDIREPKKAVSWLTDLDDRAYTRFELAKLFLNASLNSIDTYFMLLRRKTSLLERPVSSASSAYRKWFQYDPYSPQVVEKILEIYRVFYNYVKIGDDGQTPAMRLGVAKGPVKLEKIFSFRESPTELFS